MGSGQWVQSETGNSLGTSRNVFYTASFPLSGCSEELWSLLTLELYKSILDTVIGRFLEVSSGIRPDDFPEVHSDFSYSVMKGPYLKTKTT